MANEILSVPGATLKAVNSYAAETRRPSDVLAVQC